MITTKDIAWAAGFLEGEGCFGNCTGKSSRISANQVNKGPLEKLGKIFNLGTIRHVPSQKNGWKDQWSWYVYGGDAIQIMMTIYDLMSKERQYSIKQAIESWKKLALPNGKKTHCIHGHEFTEENTYTYIVNGKECRKCKTCECMRMRLKSKRLSELLTMIVLTFIYKGVK